MKKSISIILALCLCFTAVIPLTLQAAAAENYLWPVPSGTSVSQNYSSGHTALDITGAGGNIVATKSGTVIAVYSGCHNYSGAASSKSGCTSSSCSPNCGLYYNSSYGKSFCNWGYGNGVIIQHADGSGYSMYAHMDSVSVSSGATVSQGQVIGVMGSAGCSTGRHLHFELCGSVTKSGTYYKPVNSINSSRSAINYVDSPDSNPSTVTVTFLEPDADAATHCYIYDTEACVARRVTNSAGATMDGVGVNMYSYDLNEYLGSASDSSLKNNKNAWYTSYEVTGKALTKGTRYCYQFFVILYGNTYYDEIKEFTTTGSYTVSFNANGGSCTASSIAAKCGYNYGAFGTIPSASRSGYTFDGWYTAADGGTQITSATLYTRTADQTLYAHWTPIPHVHSYTAVVTAPTCTDGGFTTFSCACGDVYTADSVDPLGHSFGAWTATKEATVEEESVETRYCANCQAAETRSIPKPVPTDVPTFALSDKTVTAGTQFDVTLSVINNPGIVTASVGVTYDSAILKLVSVTDGGLLGAGTAFPGKDLTAIPYTMMWEDSLANANHTEDGVLATLTFEVLEDVPLGKTPITLSYIKNSTLNVDLDEVAFTLGNGSVEVTDRTPGDANDDGIVDLKDIVLLRRYLCGGWNVTVNLANTDVNADGAVDLKDVAILRRYLAGGWNVELK